MPSPPTTTTTLIKQLQANHPEGWKRFREYYIPVIYALAKENTSTSADAKQVIEIIVSKIAQQMPSFKRQQGEKRGTFRGLVKTICIRQINDFHRQRKRAAKKLEQQIFDKQFSQFELRRAIAIAKERTRRQSSSWELFHMHFEQNLPIKEIAAAKGIKPGTVQKTIRRAILDVQAVLNER